MNRIVVDPEGRPYRDVPSGTLKFFIGPDSKEAVLLALREDAAPALVNNAHALVRKNYLQDFEQRRHPVFLVTHKKPAAKLNTSRWNLVEYNIATGPKLAWNAWQSLVDEAWEPSEWIKSSRNYPIFKDETSAGILLSNMIVRETIMGIAAHEAALRQENVFACLNQLQGVIRGDPGYRTRYARRHNLQWFKAVHGLAKSFFLLHILRGIPWEVLWTWMHKPEIHFLGLEHGAKLSDTIPSLKTSELP